MRRSRCFVFDNQFEVAKFLWRQNQSVQLRLIPYICLPNLCPSGLSVWYRRYKDNTFTLKATWFGWQSMIFKVQFNIIKYKNIKEIHFLHNFSCRKVCIINEYSYLYSNSICNSFQYSHGSTAVLLRKYWTNLP